MCSETTKNYQLPQYQPSDHPDFLTEINEAYRKIDAVLGEIAEKSGNNSELLTALSENMKALSEVVNVLSERVTALERSDEV